MRFFKPIYKKIAITLFLMVVFLFSFSLIFAQEEDRTVDELNKEIDSQKDKIEQLKKEMDLYEKNIQLAQAKSATLKNQLEILSDQISKNNVQIEITKNQLDKLNLEINKTTKQIIEATKSIENNKKRLSEFVRLINKSDQQNFLTILTANNSFSEFFEQLNYLNEIQSQINQALIGYKETKAERENYYLTLNNQKDELDALQKKLVQQKDRLQESQASKNAILNETKLSEKTFQNNIALLKAKEKEINEEILNLEVAVRKKLLEANRAENGFDIGKEAQLGWPVSPDRGITAYFHDPDYPFRYVFEHPAIDIRAYQGTPVRAAESGYVARAKDAGYGYSYVMIIHGGGISTVYGHISRIDVQQDTYVVKGQVIGLSGATPGTRGAGRLTTGPHLHFEVRKDGIPVNPLEYLP